jgi:Tol biopolymer transport system component
MDLWVLDLDAGEQTNLTRGAVCIMSRSISWSPDGASIAFYGSLPDEVTNDLYIADPVSRAVELVQARCEVPHFGGAWSPLIPWLVPLDG